MAVIYKYNIVNLNGLIESKYCLCDKFINQNQNKILGGKSWQKIFSYLLIGYENLINADKIKIVEYR